jgi:hypothetical protein
MRPQGVCRTRSRCGRSSSRSAGPICGLIEPHDGRQQHLDLLDTSCVCRVATQELGWTPEGVTDAAGKLQGAGLIHYSRGRITVLDRPGLEARACECYDVVKRESNRLLPIRSAT